MKHTEGSWEREGRSIVVEGRGIICTCPLPLNRGVFDVEENLNLIAAAPQLLDALKNYRIADHRSCVIGDDLDHRCTTCKIADAALAKAEGRQ